MMTELVCRRCSRTKQVDSRMVVDGRSLQDWWDTVRHQLCEPCYKKAGTTARDRGMAVAVAVAPEVYKAAYEMQFVAALRSGQPFLSDHIVRVIGLPPNPNAVGGIFNGLLRRYQGQYVVVGETQMERPVAHARRTRVYQGV